MQCCIYRTHLVVPFFFFFDHIEIFSPISDHPLENSDFAELTPFALCSQMVSEKVGGAEGTKLDEDFKDLERVINTFQENIENFCTKCVDWLFFVLFVFYFVFF